MWRRIVLACFAATLALPAKAAQPAVEPFIKGVALGLFSADPKYGYERELDEIRGLNATSISLVVGMTQETIYSEEIRVGSLSPSPETILRVAANAHARGLAVLLFPVIYIVDVAPGRWRGTIEPPSWDRWFASYDKAILGYAEIAEKARIEILLVGCELITSETRDDLWLDLIRKVRAAYHGKLIYSSNWDRLSKGSFVETLDYLGANAYFELSRSDHPDKAEIVGNWERVQERYSEWQARFHKPLVLTEIGYPSVDGCARAPWNYTTDNPLDLQEQALCYQAFFEAWSGLDYLRGFYIYDWTGTGGPYDRSYTPRGKPAEAVLREWFLRIH